MIKNLIPEAGSGALWKLKKLLIVHSKTGIIILIIYRK